MFLSIIERFQSKKFTLRHDLNLDGKGANRNSEFIFIGETFEHQNESLFFFLL